MVKSPYNFVPAPTESEVFIPKWADQISHDIPFEDGESGEIEVKITAKTPIFIRNGHSKGDGEIFDKWKKGELPNPSLDEQAVLDRYLNFSNNNGEYFIPATSIKGMLRNVLEIMSFSRMKQVDGSPFFGLRDMNNPQYKSETNQKELKSGWLRKVDTGWQIDEVEHIRVSMSDIETNFKLDTRSIQDAESAIEKYNLLNGNVINGLRFSFVKNLIKTTERTTFDYGKLFRFDSVGGVFTGDLVFFGHIDNKHYDFVFGNERINSYAVDSTLIKNMDLLNQPLWEFHKSSGKIPVFFKSDNETVKHFGFSKLYRLNNGNTIGSLNKYDIKKGKDLAELIFGHSEDADNNLKGRVFISNAICEKIVEHSETEKRVLSSPKPSYYPNYLRQGGINGVLKSKDKEEYYTYINPNAKLSGYKRYPVHNTIKPNIDTDNDNIPSFFKPLAKDSEFTCKIRFHNLKKIELGALISAISFHNNENYFHSIGGGKPYGFGKVKISFTKISTDFFNTLSDFEGKMNNHVTEKRIENLTEWAKTRNMIELFAMAKSPNHISNENLKYPILELPNIPARFANEFNNYKKNREFLQKYSEINEGVEIKNYKRKAVKNSRINLDDTFSFSQIQNKMREIYNDEVADDELEIIKDRIRFVYANHKDSRKNINKPFDNYLAKTPITTWLGETQAKALHDELTKNI